MSFSERFYSALPIYWQNSIVSLYGFYWRNRRFGGDFENDLKEFKSREFWDNRKWYIYQEQKLRTLLIHAYTTVPFYRDKYSSEGFQLEDFMNFKLEFLPSLPFLEKEELREFGATTLLSEKKSKGRFYTSSGSTGTPTKIFFSPGFHRTWSAAFEARYRHWAGVDRYNSRGMIGGRVVVPANQVDPPFYRFNKAERQYYFSINHLSIHTVEAYTEVIRDAGIEYFTGYANSVWLIAKFALQKNIPPLSLKSVITSSEKLSVSMRHDIEKFYGCKVFDTYSGIEACGLISDCPSGTLHWSPDVGIMETLEIKAIDGNLSELVCTGLLNFDQPLIRYRIGDLVETSNDSICECGRNFPIIKEIVGRTDDIVTLKDGRRLGSFNRFFADLKGIKKLQVIQNDYDEFHLNIVPTEDFNESTPAAISESFQKRIGKVKLEIDLVEEIATSQNGKFKAVISKLKHK